jgi:hypothetical protein
MSTELQAGGLEPKAQNKAKAAEEKAAAKAKAAEEKAAAKAKAAEEKAAAKAKAAEEKAAKQEEKQQAAEEKAAAKAKAAEDKAIKQQEKQAAAEAGAGAGAASAESDSGASTGNSAAARPEGGGAAAAETGSSDEEGEPDEEMVAAAAAAAGARRTERRGGWTSDALEALQAQGAAGGDLTGRWYRALRKQPVRSGPGATARDSTHIGEIPAPRPKVKKQPELGMEWYWVGMVEEMRVDEKAVVRLRVLVERPHTSRKHPTMGWVRYSDVRRHSSRSRAPVLSCSLSPSRVRVWGRFFGHVVSRRAVSAPRAAVGGGEPGGGGGGPRSTAGGVPLRRQQGAAQGPARSAPAVRAPA